MKKTFQKTLIAASVGAVLAAASLGAQAASTGQPNLLFPYITTKDNTFTFISISNQVGTADKSAAYQTVSPVLGGVATGGHAPLHFTYATKKVDPVTGAFSPSDGCTHTDGDAFTTVNDLMHFEVQNRVDMPKTFDDRTSRPKYFPEGAAGRNQVGFLIVNNLNGVGYGSSNASDYGSLRLYGNAIVIDTTTGLYFSYSSEDFNTAAVGAPGTATTVQKTPDFSDATGPAGVGGDKVFSWLPTDPIVQTTLFVLPLSTETNMAFGSSSLKAGFRLVGADTTDGKSLFDGQFGGHYNNNEQFQSTETSAAVTCMGVLTRSNLVGDLSTQWSTNGGWGNLRTTTGTKAFVYKIENTRALNGASMTFMSRLPNK